MIKTIKRNDDNKVLPKKKLKKELEPIDQKIVCYRDFINKINYSNN